MPDRPFAHYPVVVIGASAGGVEALVEIVQRLPKTFPAAILITVHFPASSVSFLPQILARLDTLPAHHPVDGEPIRPGQIYIAPPDHHLIVQPGKVQLNRGPRENGHRPAIDTMFRSAAYAYGRQVIGVILTGTLDDGAVGLLTIKSRGGVAIVQDPDEALFDSMPRSAIEAVSVDWVLKLTGIADHLVKLVETLPETPSPETPSPETPSPETLNEIPNLCLIEDSAMSDSSEPVLNENEQVQRSKKESERGEQPGKASPITCPDCGGVLWELHENSVLRFRCHVGHAYSIDSLLEEHSQDVEKSLWSAIRALEEKAALARRMAVHARDYGRPKSVKQFEERAIEAHQHAEVIRQLISDRMGDEAEKMAEHGKSGRDNA